MENKLIQMPGSEVFKNYDSQGDMEIWQREKCGIESVPKILSNSFCLLMS